MAVNYSTWPVAKLKKEQEKIEKAIKAKEGKDRDKAIAAVRQAARKSGFSLQELLDGIDGSGGTSAPRGKKKASARKKTAGRKVPPKYRNPDDKSVTWSGRGRQPKWVAAWEKKHGDLEGVKI